GGGFFEPLPARRAPLWWDRPAKIFVTKLEPAAARQGLKAAFATAELAAPAGLFLVTALHLDTRFDRLAVRHLGLAQRHFDVVAVLELRDRGLDVLLAGAAEFKLFRLVVAGVAQQRVLVEQFVDRA